ncbi:hypothetical protein OE165_26880, partial [Escherichia coli]|uniref:hypothetical protein n=1 Tax=Escherichia coli TaxID=562 RepID=UPI0021F24FE3
LITPAPKATISYSNTAAKEVPKGGSIAPEEPVNLPEDEAQLSADFDELHNLIYQRDSMFSPPSKDELPNEFRS